MLSSARSLRRSRCWDRGRRRFPGFLLGKEPDVASIRLAVSLAGRDGAFRGSAQVLGDLTRVVGVVEEVTGGPAVGSRG
jgi:hypothetical protein